MMNLQNKKILYLLSGNDPSAFVRATVYKEELKKQGINATFFQLRALKLMKLKKKCGSLFFLKNFLEIIIGIYYNIRNFYLLRIVSKYDVIVAVKYLKSSLLNKIKSKSHALLVYDFDDSVWLNHYYGEKEFSKRIKSVDCVTSDNLFLAGYAAQYNRNSYVVNGPCQVEKFIEHKSSLISIEKTKQHLTLGWVGSPHTMAYLYSIYDALEIIGENYPEVSLKIVGSGTNPSSIPHFDKINVKTIPYYDQSEMIKQIFSFDIGLIPFFRNSETIGRGTLKTNVCMAAGVPVICSRFGENERIIEEGLNGLLANKTNEWVEKISFLIENPSKRKEIGMRGFEFVKDNYSIKNCLNQFLSSVNKAITDKLESV